MRARIIFRGLTVFTFADRPSKGARPNSNLGKMTAWLLTDPAHGDHPLHTHKPVLSFIGRDRNGQQPQPNARPDKDDDLTHVATKLRLTRPTTTIRLEGHPQVPDGVIVDESFLDYVPVLSDLYGGVPPRNAEQTVHELENSNFVTSRIEIPSGTIRTGEFVSWHWRGNTPSRVGFMDTPFQGYITNEVIVDVGDDSDFPKPDKRKFLSVADGQNLKQELWPRFKTPIDDHIDPNVVEVLITNLPARRSRGVPWGLHVFTAFQAAGCSPRANYVNAEQFNTFLRVIDDDYGDEWQADFEAMKVNGRFPWYPFPFFIDPERDRLEGLSARPAVPPQTPGRRRGEGPPAGHDPVRTEICPFLKE